MMQMTVFPAHDKIDAHAVEDFKTRFAGRLIYTNSPDYDAIRASWGGLDEYPAIIARAISVPDVIEAVNFARKNGVPLAVRGSEWNMGEQAVPDDGLVIDLSRMKTMRVDTPTHTVRAQAGATWDELNQFVQPFTLSAKDMVAVEIVTWDGRWLTTTEHEHVHLFWGTQQGYNVGVVVAFVSPLDLLEWDIPQDYMAFPAVELEAIFGY
jgi:hypothetical protein